MWPYEDQIVVPLIRSKYSQKTSLPKSDRLLGSFDAFDGAAVQVILLDRGRKSHGRDHFGSVVRGLWMIVYRKAAANSNPVFQLGFPFPSEEWRFARVVFSA